MPDWLLDACQRIRNPENLAIGLTKFREICDKDMSYINRAMRRYLNSTPTEFINTARLKYAAWLLETSSYPTSEISDMCGFSDLPYFCRKFKDKYEYTPSQFRKNALNAVEKSDINYSYKMKNIKKVKA
jgi:AraC family cel operon transcriptional repressor